MDSNFTIQKEIGHFIKAHEVKSAVVTDGIIGSPHHEEGIDCPVGEDNCTF